VSTSTAPWEEGLPSKASRLGLALQTLSRHSMETASDLPVGGIVSEHEGDYFDVCVALATEIARLPLRHKETQPSDRIASVPHELNLDLRYMRSRSAGVMQGAQNGGLYASGLLCTGHSCPGTCGGCTQTCGICTNTCATCAGVTCDHSGCEACNPPNTGVTCPACPNTAGTCPENTCGPCS